MKPHSIRWPTIIAMLVAGAGLCGVFSASQETWSAQPVRITWDWHVMAISGVLLAMSYPLAAGREWARRVLLVAILVIGVGLVLWNGFKVVAPMGFNDLTADQIKVVREWQRLQDISSFFLVLATFASGVLFLSHADVVRSFERSSDERANV